MSDPITQAELQQAIADCITTTRKNSLQYTDGCFPQIFTIDGMYPTGKNTEWTPGFFTGIHWLCYELTQDEAFKAAALAQVDSFYTRIVTHDCTDNHDLGFLYTLSCTAAYQLTGSEKAQEAALLAADELLLRFQEKGQFLQAWGATDNPAHYRMIIDCLLNVPLLYWASEQTGNAIYREKAVAHSETAMRHLFRLDCSTYHTFFFEPLTGAPVKGITAQGYSNDTAWARGQAWGIYGMALCYRYTRNPKALAIFRGVLDYYLQHLPENDIPFWDLSFTDGSGEPWDSSAAAIAACGVLEMASLVDTETAAAYHDLATKIAGSLYRHCRAIPAERQTGLLLHGVYNKKSPFNTREDAGVDESNLWGDYFWLELLARLTVQWVPYW